MSKNYSEDRLANRVPQAINNLMKKSKQDRTDQIQPNGYFAFAQGTADPAGAPNGSVYYNTSTNKLRLKKNTGWIDII